MEEIIVISLGGALIVPEEIDVEFLKSFKSLILSQVAKGKKFLIDTGGGRTCRKYQNAASEMTTTTTEDKDWIGIATNNLNAELLRVIFGDKAHPKVIYNLAEKFSLEHPVVIGGAYEPGHSSDFDAVLAAKNLGAKKILNLSNIDYAYDKDPKKFPDAKKIENIFWPNYRALIPAEWSSGLNTPFDPIASKMAQEEGMEVMILNGKNIANLEKCLDGEQFLGTKIS
ncbi:MAG: UMP kinase [Patescibacteria group bacterium]|nr:UMP kinase [Patescibacteria group bacterium]